MESDRNWSQRWLLWNRLYFWDYRGISKGWEIWPGIGVYRCYESSDKLGRFRFERRKYTGDNECE